MGFAPYDDPEIVIAVVIEHGAKSSFAANVAREVFDAYMEIKEGKFNGEETEEDEENTADDVDVLQKRRRENKNGDGDDTEGRMPQNSLQDSTSEAEGEGTL